MAFQNLIGLLPTLFTALILQQIKKLLIQHGLLLVEQATIKSMSYSTSR